MVSQGISPLIEGDVKSGVVCEMPIWSIGTASNSIKLLSWGFSVVFLLVVAVGEVIVGVEGVEDGVGQEDEEDDAVNDVKLLEEEAAGGGLR